MPLAQANTVNRIIIPNTGRPRVIQIPVAPGPHSTWFFADARTGERIEFTDSTPAQRSAHRDGLCDVPPSPSPETRAGVFAAREGEGGR